MIPSALDPRRDPDTPPTQGQTAHQALADATVRASEMLHRRHPSTRVLVLERKDGSFIAAVVTHATEGPSAETALEQLATSVREHLGSHADHAAALARGLEACRRDALGVATTTPPPEPSTVSADPAAREAVGPPAAPR